MQSDDLFVQVHRRKLCCVLDPALVLGTRLGFEFALRVAAVLEPWLTRSFWQVIDASELLMPQLVGADSANDPREFDAWDANDDLTRPLPAALEAWIGLRERTDAGSWPFRWVGDNLAESQLQASADAGVVTRYETLAESLGARVERFGDAPGGWDQTDASLDALALSAALDSAVVLMAAAGGAPPWPVQALARIGRPAQLLDPMPASHAASLFGAERELLRSALAAAGLAGLVQDLPPLAALHVNVARPNDGAGGNPWDRAQAWWYFL
ncbi:hypothetical protein [Caballeronia sp. GaOx3]|uniref:hypothetical protein n=1 Tax=Caballeronia sp. GaOx3 TaxID=2921740 RepID=UPI0020298C5D|nr:hypothetical protein [Caballeronia sp. GaOx3]